MDIGRLIAYITADSREFEMAVRDAQESMDRAEASITKSADRVGQAWEDAGKKMQTVGKNMSKYITLPLAAIGGASFKMAMDFDKSMQKVVGLVGVAQEQVDAWRRDLMEMAPELAKSPGELAEGLYFVTSAGWRGAEAMELLEMSARAAAAGLGDTASIAHLASSAMNAYGYETLNAEQAIDILVATVREGKAAPEELASTMARLLPVAAEMGIGFDQLGSAIALFTRTGLSAGMATTHLQGILRMTMRPTHALENSLARLGMTTREFQDAIRERGLVEALQNIRDLVEETESVELADMFRQQQALAGVLMLTGDNAEEARGIFERVADSTGDLEKAFKVASETAHFKWNQSLIAGQAALTELGETVTASALPIIEALTDRIRTATEWWHNLDDSTKRNIVAVAGFMAVAGPALIVIGKMATGIGALIKGVGGMVRVINAARVATLRLNAAMALNPWALAIGAIAAATAALVLWNRRKAEGTELDRAYANVQKEVSKEVDSQTAKIHSLTQVIENNNLPLHVRQRAIEDLNRIVPEYNANLDEEGRLTGHNTRVLKDYLRELENKIRLQSYEEEFTRLVREQQREVRRLQELQAAEADMQERSLAWRLANYRQVHAVTGEIERSKDAIDEKQEAIEGIRDSWEEFGEKVEQTGRAIKFNREQLQAIHSEFDPFDIPETEDKGKDAEERLKSLKMLQEELMAQEERYMEAAGPHREEIMADALQQIQIIEKQIEELDNAARAAAGLTGEIEDTKDSLKDTKTRAEELKETFEAIRMEEAVFDDFDALDTKIRASQRAIRDFIADMVSGEDVDMEAFDSVVENFKELERQAEKRETERFIKGIGENIEELGRKALIMQGLGIEFDLASAKVQALERDLVELEQRGEEGTAQWYRYKEMLKEARNELDFREVMDSLSEELDSMRHYTEEWSDVLGDDLGAVVSSFEEGFEGLSEALEQGLDITDDRVQEIIEQLRELGIEFDELISKQQRFENVSLQVAQSVGNSFAQLVSDSDRSSREIVGHLLREVTALLIRNILAAGNIAFPASLFIAAGAPAMAEALFSSIKMKHGGIVPPGYDDDKYPAYLSSKEVVTPPEKLEGYLMTLGREIVSRVTPPDIDYNPSISHSSTIDATSLGEFSQMRSGSRDFTIKLESTIEHDHIRLSNERALRQKSRVE